MSKVASRVSQCIRAPIQTLRRARDLYVRSMMVCARRVHYGSIIGHPMFFQRASSSKEDDLRELIRAASKGRLGPLGHMAEVGGGVGGGVVVSRSLSVVIGQIDEDRPCEFDDEVGVGSNLLLPRSRSCGVAARRRVGGGVWARSLA